MSGLLFCFMLYVQRIYGTQSIQSFKTIDSNSFYNEIEKQTTLREVKCGAKEKMPLTVVNDLFFVAVSAISFDFVVNNVSCVMFY